MNTKFTHLHVHSHYSLLDGLPKVDQLLDRAKELEMDSIALTDHGNLYGAVEFYKKAKERQIKPIIGTEMYLALESMDQRRPNIDDKRYHFILLVKNKTGYKNLVKLITEAYLRGFYYKPRVDENLLAKYADGLIMLSGCLQGKIPRLILSNKFNEAKECASFYQEIFGKNNFYLELQHHPNIREQQIANNALIEISKALKIPLVATHDIHYLKPEDAEAQDILMLINTDSNKDDPERLTMKADDFSMKSPQEMAEFFKHIPEAIENTQKIANACNFEFELGKLKMPSFPLPEGIFSEDEYLRELCLAGLDRLGLSKDKDALKRLERELLVIKQTGFASYFLIVQDFVGWAKQNRIVVGPGRGSVAGSLVAYALGITNVNPLQYGLIFERFINPERISPPDIDLDFTDRRRDEVISYVAQKYGQNRVAQIITFGTMAARAVVRDVGRALGYSYSYCDQLAKMIPFSFTLEQALKKIKEFREFYGTDEKARRLIDIAKKLEGVARHASTHACGVVISKDPLDELIPLQHPTQSDSNIVTQYEMHAIEDLGLLKMDFLGLKNLTTIEDTLARIYAISKKNIDIQNIPLDDKKTYELLQKGETVGVFQLESGGMQRYLKELKPTHFEDIIAMVALYRPGPMEWIPEYIARKHKKKRIEYLHPDLKPILENTYGICVFQEQLMQIAQQLAGFSLAEADTLRKAVGKKIKSLLLEQEAKMIEGMKKRGISEKITRQIWEWTLPFARYAFNKSHSVCYAMIAYQTAYLKAHYPLELMSALLTNESSDVERIGFLIEECKKMGIKVLPPDINESFRTFSVVPEINSLRFGLLAIKNVGHNVVEAIVSERKRHGAFISIEDFLSRVVARELNKKSLESLIKAGAFDKFGERNQLLYNIEQLLEFARTAQKNKESPQRGLFDSDPTNTFTRVSLKLALTRPATDIEKLQWEKELLGLYVSGHPLKNYKKALEKKVLPLAQISQELVGKLVKIGVVVSGIKKIVTKTGKPMLFLNVEDETRGIEVVAFPAILEKNPTIFQQNKIILISGRVDIRDGIPKIIANDVEEVIENEQ